MDAPLARSGPRSSMPRITDTQGREWRHWGKAVSGAEVYAVRVNGETHLADEDAINSEAVEHLINKRREPGRGMHVQVNELQDPDST